MASNNVTIEVDLITRRAQANAEALSGSVLGLSSKMNLIVQAVDLASMAFDSVVSAIKPFADAAIEATKSAIAFEASLAAIETIAAGADIGKLRKDLLDLSSAFGFDELSTAKAQYDLLSAGITDAADAALVLKNSAVLATAGVDTLESASKTVATSINAFGLAASDSAHITDVLAKTTQFGVLTLNELGGAFGNVAPVAAGAGLSIEETSAAIAAYTLSGKGAAEASTGLKALLVSLLKPSDDLQKAFTKATGASVAQSLANKGLSATLAEVNKIAGGTSEGWIKFTGGADAASAGLTLAVAKGKEFNSFTKDMSDGTKKAGEAVQSMANVIEKTADFQLKSMVQTLKNVGTELASVFEPAIAAAAQIITEFAVEFRDFIRENEAGLREIGKAAVQMVKDFGEFAKAIVNSQEFKTAISVLKDVALTSFTEMESAIKRVSAVYTEVFGGMNKDTQALQTVIKLFGEAIKLYLGNVIRDFENIAKAAILFGDSLNKAFGVAQGAGNTLLSLQSKLFGTGDAASFAAQKIDAFEESQSKIKPPDFGWVKNNVAALNTREAALKRGQSLDEAAAGQAVKLTDAQKKAMQELANFVNDQESTQYANKEERLVDYERNWNAHSMGITSVAQQTYSELRKYDEEYAKQKAKDLEDEVKRLESAQEDAVKAARDELDRQQKFLQEGLAYQEQYAQEQKKFWMDLASTIVSSLSSSVSAWSAIAEEENEAVADSATKAAASELETYTALSNAKIELLKEESDKRIEALKSADTESIDQYKKASDDRLAARLEEIETVKQAEIDAISEQMSEAIDRQKEASDQKLKIELEGIENRKTAEFDSISKTSNAKLAALKAEQDAAKGARDAALDDLLFPVEARKEEELTRLREVQREELKNSKEMTIEAVAAIKVRQREEAKAIELKYAPEIDAITRKTDAENAAAEQAFAKKKEAIENEEKIAKDAISKRYETQAEYAKKAEKDASDAFKKQIDEQGKLTIDAIKSKYETQEKLEKRTEDLAFATFKAGIDKRQKLQIDSIEAAFKKEKEATEKIIAMKKGGLEVDRKSESLTDKKLAAASKTAADIGAVLEKIPGPVGEIGSTIAGLTSLVFQLPEIMRGIPAMVQGFLEAIPLLIVELIKAIPVMIKGLIKAIPQVIEGFVEAIPTIITELLMLITDPSFMIDIVEALFKSIMEMNFVKLATAVVDGIWNALVGIFYRFLELGAKIWDGFLKPIGKFFANAGKEIWEGFLKPIGNFFADAGKLMGDAFAGAFKTVVDGLNGLFDGFADLFRPKGTPLSQAEKDKYNTELPGLNTGGSISGISFGLVGSNQDPWKVAPQVAQPVSQPAPFDAYTHSGTVGYEDLSNKMIARAISLLPQMTDSSERSNYLMGVAVDYIREFLGDSSWIQEFQRRGTFDSYFAEIVGNASQAVRGIGYAYGGIAGRDSPSYDTIPALLSPGELVIPRSAVSGGMGDILAFAADAMNVRPGAMIGMARGGMIGNSSSTWRQETTALSDELRDLRSDVRQIGYAVAKYTQRTSDQLARWDVDGLPETRTA